MKEFVFFHHYFPENDLLYALNFQRRFVRNERLTDFLKKAGYDEKQHFIAGESRTHVSLLSFYSPGQKLAYYFDFKKEGENQFSFYNQEIGKEFNKDAYFVTIASISEIQKETFVEEHKQFLLPYFKEIDFIESFPLFKKKPHKKFKQVFIFKCHSYSGGIPYSL